MNNDYVSCTIRKIFFVLAGHLSSEERHYTSQLALMLYDRLNEDLTDPPNGLRLRSQIAEIVADHLSGGCSEGPHMTTIRIECVPEALMIFLLTHVRKCQLFEVPSLHFGSYWLSVSLH